MEKPLQAINHYLVDVYNDIIKIEESELRNGPFKDISLSELHTIEAIGMYEKQTMTEVARKLDITVGTLTVAINNLTKKDYVERLRSETDRRVVRLGLTKKGRLVYRVHHKFHSEMVKQTIVGLNDEETAILVRALENLHQFLSGKYDNGNNK